MIFDKLKPQQQRLIRYLLEDDLTLKEALHHAGVPKSTYYDWKKTEVFQAALKEVQDIKTKAQLDYVKDSVGVYLDRIDELSKSSKNDMVKYQASKTMLAYGGVLEPKSEEITINTKDESDDKNKLLWMLKQKKEDEQERLH